MRAGKNSEGRSFGIYLEEKREPIIGSRGGKHVEGEEEKISEKRRWVDRDTCYGKKKTKGKSVREGRYKCVRMERNMRKYERMEK